jgi:hypothetical protein
MKIVINKNSNQNSPPKYSCFKPIELSSPYYKQVIQPSLNSKPKIDYIQLSNVNQNTLKHEINKRVKINKNNDNSKDKNQINTSLINRTDYYGNKNKKVNISINNYNNKSINSPLPEDLK